MTPLKGFNNLNTTACAIIYVVNGFLILGLIILAIFVLPVWLWTFLYALQAAGQGSFTPLLVMIFILLWFPVSLICFVAVIGIAIWKQKWSWIIQFLPFVIAVSGYLILIISTHFYGNH